VRGETIVGQDLDGTAGAGDLGDTADAGVLEIIVAAGAVIAIVVAAGAVIAMDYGAASAIATVGELAAVGPMDAGGAIAAVGALAAVGPMDAGGAIVAGETMDAGGATVAGEATDAGGAMDGDGGANVKIGNPLPMKLGQQLGHGL